MQELFRRAFERHLSHRPAYNLRKNVPRGTLWNTLAMVLLFSSQLFAQHRTPSLVHILFSTDVGNFEVAVDTARAPITANNFLKYVDGGYYNGGVFHRTVKLDNQPGKNVLIEVVQAGANPTSGAGFPAIALERTNKTGIAHRDGTISMARDAADTATSDFFICINDQPQLDFGGKRNPDGQGFAAFGNVVSGIDVIRKIQAAPAEGQALTPPVRILSAHRKNAPKNEPTKSKLGRKVN